MRALRIPLFSVLVLAISTAAAADSFAVTSGRLVFDFEGDWFELSGSGFSMSSRIPIVDPPGPVGPHHPVTFSNFCSPCQTGEVLDLSFETSAGEQPFGAGAATLLGAAHSEVFYLASFAVRVQPLTIPATDASSLSVRQSFTLSGSIRGFADPTYSTAAFTANIHGRGTAITRYFRDADSGGFLPEEGQLAFVFDEPQPVPEPLSVVLVGTGLAAIVVRRRRT